MSKPTDDWNVTIKEAKIKRSSDCDFGVMCFPRVSSIKPG